MAFEAVSNYSLDPAYGIDHTRDPFPMFRPYQEDQDGRGSASREGRFGQRMRNLSIDHAEFADGEVGSDSGTAYSAPSQNRPKLLNLSVSVDIVVRGRARGPRRMAMNRR
jgi:hypothetical protein